MFRLANYSQDEKPRRRIRLSVRSSRRGEYFPIASRRSRIPIVFVRFCVLSFSLSSPCLCVRLTGRQASPLGRQAAFEGAVSGGAGAAVLCSDISSSTVVSLLLDMGRRAQGAACHFALSKVFLYFVFFFFLGEGAGRQEWNFNDPRASGARRRGIY